MADPYNYTFAQTQSPFEALTSGFKSGFGMRQAIDERAQAQAAAEAKTRQEAQMREDLARVSSNPTTEEIVKLSIKYPQLSENFKRSYDMLSPAEKDAKLAHASRVQFALKTGQSDVAYQVQKDYATALRNAGKENEAKAADSLAETIRADPKAAMANFGLLLAPVMGVDKYAETYAKIGGEQRAQDLAPSELRSANAKAQGEEADATTKGVTANYAEQKAKAEIAQMGAELGLTKAQTRQAMASAASLSASAQKTVLEMESLKANGGVPPEKKFEQEQKLRAEYHAQAKPFTDMKEAYGRIVSAEQTGPGDIAIVYSYMKILDPTSVVREGEFATAQNSAGVPEAIRALANKVANGQRLTPKQRNDFISQSKSLMNKAGVREKEVRKGIDTIAGNYGLNKQNIYFNDHNVENEAPQNDKDVLSAADAILAGGRR